MKIFSKKKYKVINSPVKRWGETQKNEYKKDYDPPQLDYMTLFLGIFTQKALDMLLISYLMISRHVENYVFSLFCFEELVAWSLHLNIIKLQLL